MSISLVTMESIFSLDHFSAIAADLHYVLLLGQPLPEFLCTAWHISSQPAPSVPLILGQHVLLISPASRTYFGCLRSIVKIEKSSLVIYVSPGPSAYGPFLPDTCHVHLPLSFILLSWMRQIQYSHIVQSKPLTKVGHWTCTFACKGGTSQCWLMFTKLGQADVFSTTHFWLYTTTTPHHIG